MKKMILAAAIAVAGIFNSASAQKIGYINTEDLMMSMPEIDKIDKDLQDYQNYLQEMADNYMEDLQTKDSIFKRDSSKLSATMKEIKRKELIEAYQKVSTFQQTSQQQMQQKQQELLVPIRDKALNAVKAVAKENNYAYVLDIQSVIVGPPGDDLGALVRKKLGIKEPAAAPATAPKR